MANIVLFTNVTVNKRNAHTVIRRNRPQRTDPEAKGKKRNYKTILRPGPKLVPFEILTFCLQNYKGGVGSVERLFMSGRRKSGLGVEWLGSWGGLPFQCLEPIKCQEGSLHTNYPAEENYYHCFGRTDGTF